MSYTKGPWSIVGFFITSHHGDRKKSVVAEVDRHVWTSAAEVIANAHLIASAPELLEVCKLLQDNREQCCIPDNFFSKDGKSFDTLLDQAIAKAEGKF